MSFSKNEKQNLKRGGKRPGSGRKKFVPSEAERKQVEAMAGFGVPVLQIASLIRGGICYETLAKYFENELVQGKAKASLKIGSTLYQKALGGDTTALIWWSKAQMGWRDTTSHEVTGKDGGDIKITTIKRVITRTNNSDS